MKGEQLSTPTRFRNIYFIIGVSFHPPFKKKKRIIRQFNIIKSFLPLRGGGSYKGIVTVPLIQDK